MPSTIFPIVMSELLQTVQSIFPPVLSGHLAARLGVSVGSINLALKGALPVMLGGLTVMATENATEAYALCQQASRNTPASHAGVTGILVVLGSKDAGGSSMLLGSRLLKVAFGDSEEAIINALGEYAKIEPSLVRTLLQLVGTTLLGAAGKYAMQHELTAEAMAGALSRLRGSVVSMLPQELQGLIDVLGLYLPSRWNMTPKATVQVVEQPAPTRQSWAHWYMLAMVVLLMTGTAVYSALRTVRQTTRAAAPNSGQTISVASEEENVLASTGF